jgi:hypothetical protein
VEENNGAAAIDLTPDDLRDIDGAASKRTIFSVSLRIWSGISPA